MIDFMRLKTNSICQRRRFSRIVAASKASARVVQIIKYCVFQRFFPSRPVEAIGFSGEDAAAKRAASALSLMAIKRPFYPPTLGVWHA